MGQAPQAFHGFQNAASIPTPAPNINTISTSFVATSGTQSVNNSMLSSLNINSNMGLSNLQGNLQGMQPGRMGNMAGNMQGNLTATGNMAASGGGGMHMQNFNDMSAIINAGNLTGSMGGSNMQANMMGNMQANLPSNLNLNMPGAVNMVSGTANQISM